jgi:uncharacterized Zn-binding protein involved in type VI secretion
MKITSSVCKHIGSYPQKKACSYSKYYSVNFESNTIKFQTSTPTSLQYYSNNFCISTHQLTIITPTLKLSSNNKCYIKNKEAITIFSDEINLTTSSTSLKIQRNKIQLQSSSLQLSTPQVHKNTLISCLNDQHQCPANNGGQPHVGGQIIEGSSNVFINNKAVARHNDLCLCQQIPNPLIATEMNIRVNAKPIGYMFANTNHGGKIITGQNNASLTPSSEKSANTKKVTTTDLNEINLSYHYFHSNKQPHYKIQINFTSKTKLYESFNNPISTTNLQASQLAVPFQLTIGV